MRLDQCVSSSSGEAVSNGVGRSIMDFSRAARPSRCFGEVGRAVGASRWACCDPAEDLTADLVHRRKVWRRLAVWKNHPGGWWRLNTTHSYGSIGWSKVILTCQSDSDISGPHPLHVGGREACEAEVGVVGLDNYVQLAPEARASPTPRITLDLRSTQG